MKINYSGNEHLDGRFSVIPLTEKCTIITPTSTEYDDSIVMKLRALNQFWPRKRIKMYAGNNSSSPRHHATQYAYFALTFSARKLVTTQIAFPFPPSMSYFLP
ncbi:hypothetical protein CEXT_146061 [Caerostris extrusa]|uniref:Uncharacterized protein n=1 Tax=Caerostris extrusa TaxID=172846 RepID=A0AAV4PET2_CAEEX|nr:hypothetical protein CEXT_146061 [Caerostris extrusa]